MITASTETFPSKLLGEQFVMFLDKNLLKITGGRKFLTSVKFPHS